MGAFCPNDNLECMSLLRGEDKLINWNKPLYINFVHSKIADELMRLYEGHGSVEQVLGDVWACDEPEKTEQYEDEPPMEADVDVQVTKHASFFLSCVKTRQSSLKSESSMLSITFWKSNLRFSPG